jgi:MFS superfamily sulfate permease-like transporter
MSYASSLARLNPVNGLFGAAIPCAVYALLGTSPQLSLGPEAALSLMTGETIASILSDLPEYKHSASFILSIASLITLQAGLVTFLLGILRLGFLDAVLSRPLLRGFVTAVGVVIIVSQMIPILGLSACVH